MYDIIVQFLDTVSVGDLFFVLSQLVIIIGFSFNDILLLRLVSTIAFFLLITAALLLDNMIMLSFGLFFLVFNGIRLSMVILDRRPIQLHGELKEVYESYFSLLRPKEFVELWKLGESLHKESGQIYSENDEFHGLYFITKGRVTICKAGLDIVSMSDGFFVGEMSFITGDTASADVKAVAPLTMRYWSKEVLSRLHQSHLDLYMKIHTVIGCDLVLKLKTETHGGLSYMPRS